MQDAYGQAVKYVETLDQPPPFLLTCDIGHCFDLYAAFGAERDYHPFPNARKNRIFLTDLGRIAAVRAALHTTRGQDVEAVAKTFSRAARKDVEVALQALEALGLAVAYDTAKSGRLWRLTGRRAA
jgi:hypothetical protein